MVGHSDSGTYILEQAEHFWPCHSSNPAYIMEQEQYTMEERQA
jgi:hypothetical protein